MKKFIKQKLREQMIDGQEMNQATQIICNKMTVNDYNEAIRYVQAAMKGVDETTRAKIMDKIRVPLENLKSAQKNIGDEIKITHMSGDSMVDEADTYWHQIQSTICEQGPNFQ